LRWPRSRVAQYLLSDCPDACTINRCAPASGSDPTSTSAEGG
jgi:hypothetical protein